MKASNLRIVAVMLLVAALVVGTRGWTQSRMATDLPVAGYSPATDLPGAHELPDPSITYKVVFDVSKAAPKPDDVNPVLVAAARYLNTLAKYGVPQDHRKFAVVFHQEGTPIVQNSAAYKAGHSGRDNPNIAIIQSLKKAGVDLRVCGQGVLAYKVDPQTILPEIQVDLWALNTMVTLQQRGYVRMGG